MSWPNRNDACILIGWAKIVLIRGEADEGVPEMLRVWNGIIIIDDKIFGFIDVINISVKGGQENAMISVGVNDLKILL